MKVLQVPYGFYPDPVGGTEVYVASLSRHLQELGLQIIVAAPGETDSRYHHEGLPVHRYAVGHAPTLDALYGRHDPVVARAFAHVLDEHRPDIVHLHAFTRGVSLSVVREAKRRHVPTVFTYHTPTVSCQRGTMMRWGHHPCDGYVDLGRCTRCTLHGLGLPHAGANAVSKVPVRAGYLLGTAGLSGGIWTALRMRQLVEVRSAGFHSLMREVDHVIAVCTWVMSVLLLNRVPREKITISRHGLDTTLPAKAPPSTTQRANKVPLRIAFLGRLDPTKGLHVLIKALRCIPDAPVQLDIYGIAQGAESESYYDYLRRLAGEDKRFEFKLPVANVELIRLLSVYDLLAVPSQWLETGPLVVLEAFAAGIPVLGSDLGGISEQVEHEVDGLLVPPNSVDAWTRALQRLINEPMLLCLLQSGVRSPRLMSEVAEDMFATYESVITQSSVPSRSSVLGEHS